ncbi:MAG: response regulator transcription factor [Anaerolineales bacterium]
MSQTRVLVVDDHAVVRLGLKTLIGDQPGLEVAGEAGSAAEALEAVARLRPDVVLMDIRMPGESGLEATRQIMEQFPATKVVMLTSFADDELLMRAIRAGAVGYVLKQADNDALLRAIHSAARGDSPLDAGLTARLMARVREADRQAERDAFRDLAQRELEVLAGVARGKSNAAIAQDLSLSEKTVSNYVSHILEKLGLSNRVELATYAVEHRLDDRLRRDDRP